MIRKLWKNPFSSEKLFFFLCINSHVLFTKGQVLIFLDANTEVTDGWLEPILSRIASDRSVVVTPRIDSINITTIAYEKYNDTAVYGLGWDLAIHLYVNSIGVNNTDY